MDRQTLIIDPPVTPFSAPAEIERWIARLERMLDEKAPEGGLLHTGADREVIIGSIAQAREYLRLAEQAPLPPSGA